MRWKGREQRVREKGEGRKTTARCPGAPWGLFCTRALIAWQVHIAWFGMAGSVAFPRGDERAHPRCVWQRLPSATEGAPPQGSLSRQTESRTGWHQQPGPGTGWGPMGRGGACRGHAGQRQAGSQACRRPVFQSRFADEHTVSPEQARTDCEPGTSELGAHRLLLCLH